MALTRIPSGASSSAAVRVSPSRPALLAAYADCGSRAVVRPSTLEMLTMLDPGCITFPQACAIQ